MRLLPLGAVAIAPAFAVVVVAQSYVGGDLSSEPGPYGIPPSDFADATSTPAGYVTYPIVGYNTSIPAGPVVGTSNQVSGWRLTVSTFANVPLTDADSPSVDKDQYFSATTLSISPPASLSGDYSTDDWRLCAIVFRDGLPSGTGDKPDSSGTCSELLPDGCITDLQAKSVATNGTDAPCVDLKIPKSCKGLLGVDDGVAYELAPSTGSDNRFFAAGSSPFSQRGNRTALEQADGKIWPVLLTWSHFGEGGQLHDSAGWLSCGRVATRGGTPPTDGAASSYKPSKWASIIAALVMLV